MPDYINPKTGNREVWSVRPQGYLTDEEWQAAHPHVPEPVPQDELFAMLRSIRDMKLGETDYLIMPDYPLTDAKRETVTAYRQALRDLPGLTGAPWDGGGDKTPWPVREF